MAGSRVSIDALPEATVPAGVVVMQDGGVTKKLATTKLTGEPTADAHIAATDGAHAASAVSVTPAAPLSGNNVAAQLSQAATALGTLSTDLVTVSDDIEAVGDGLAAHINDPIDAHDASAVSYVPGETIAATDVQAAIEQTYADGVTRLNAHKDAIDAHPAANIPFTPTGTVGATNVQAAIAEVAAEIAAGGGTLPPGGLTNQILIKISDTDYAVTWAFVPYASDAGAGNIEIATQAEALTGTDYGRAITPLTLDYVLDQRGTGGGGGISADAGNLLTLGTDGKPYLSEAAFTDMVMSRLLAKTFIANAANPPAGYTPGSAWIEREP